MSTDKSRPVIIVKKKGGHEGHHGGAWKVAYADFVTAMMSLFIVLWLMNSSPSVKQAVAGYFKDPRGVGKMTGTAQAGKGANGQPQLDVRKEDMPRLKDELQKALQGIPNFKEMKDQVVMTITADGLRIEMLETEKGMFFDSGSPKPTGACIDLLRSLSAELGTLPNRIMIEGHTDAQPYAASGAYSNWELSTDRANEARRLMQTSGLRPDQVSQVRGFAEQDLRDPAHPTDPSNRRISVIVQYTHPDGGAANPDAAAEQKPKGAGQAQPATEQKPKGAGQAQPATEQKPKGAGQAQPAAEQKPRPAGEKQPAGK